MKIFYIVSSLEGGGAEFAIPDIVSALEAAGGEVRLFACERRDGMAAPRLERAGIPFELLPEGGRTRRLRTLRARARAEKPDLIWTSLPRATLDGQILGRLLGLPVVSWQHSAFTRPYKRWAMPILQRLSDIWIADSRSVADYLRSAMRVPQRRIMRWPLFVARQDQPQAAPWGGQGPLRIGSLGRLSPHKDYPTLLAAFARLREIAPDVFARSRLLIAGSGPDEAALRRLAADLGIADRLDLIGYLDDPADFLASLHVYAQPSRMEGMCIAAHEAMAAALPVISTAVGELRFSVREGKTGFHIGPSDVEGLAARLADLGRAPDRARAMGLAARRYVLDQFSPEGFAEAARAIMVRALPPAGA